MNALDTFKHNVSEVDRLVHFDKEILELVTLMFSNLHEQLRHKHADERLNGGRALKMIKGIRTNATLQSKYQAIYNQAVVLLVSHFSSALGELFRYAVSERLSQEDPGDLLREDFKLTVSDLRDRDWSLKGAIPDLLIAKHDLTFQDMASTVRAFKAYTGRSVLRDDVMNNIITAQACRHVIVHAGGKVSEKMLKQVSGANPRQLKKHLNLGDEITFSIEEFELVKQNMLIFVDLLTTS